MKTENGMSFLSPSTGVYFLNCMVSTIVLK